MIRIIAIGLVLGLLTADTMAAPGDDLHRLFDDYWDHEMEINPFSATSSGINLYNDRVPDVSPAAQTRALEARQRFSMRLNDIDLSSVNANDRLSAEILAFILEHDIALAQFEQWRIPFLSDAGFHSNFGYVVGSTPFNNEEDYRNYLMRLAAFPGYLDQNIENMRAGLASGFTQPKEILANILPSFEAQVTDTAENHPFYRPFKSIPDTIAPDVRNDLELGAKSVLDDQVIPTYARLLSFMRDEYLPGARETLGATELPNGPEYYAALVRYFTTLDDANAGAIHQRGLDEVDRIRNEMDAVIVETDFDGSFEEFLNFLRSDPQFYAKTPQEILMRAAWISKKIDGRLPGFFGKLPRQPYSVEPVPMEIAANYTGGRYVSSPPGGSRGGQYWVNTYALHTRPLYQLAALSLHEGVPGHHFQGALAYEVENAPAFRMQFYPHAFGEGWGLYSEKLGVEMGIYDTPYDHFGRLSYEMWRACRLVVDTGLHGMGWTRRQAVDYLATNTALSLHSIGTEVDRYIAWPAQALAYKMGELTIWDLRAKSERELGRAFDIREFHDSVLTKGGLPLQILRSQIDAYIAARQ